MIIIYRKGFFPFSFVVCLFLLLELPKLKDSGVASVALTVKNLPTEIGKREKSGKRGENREKEEKLGRKGKSQEGSYTFPFLTDGAGYATEYRSIEPGAPHCIILFMLKFTRSSFENFIDNNLVFL